jgi:hypothetical protein
MNGADTREYEYTSSTRVDDTAIQLWCAGGPDRSPGGTDIVTEPWGRRNLAYPINRFLKATTSSIAAQCTDDGSHLRYAEDVIRYLLMRQDEMIRRQVASGTRNEREQLDNTPESNPTLRLSEPRRRTLLSRPVPRAAK